MDKNKLNRLDFSDILEKEEWIKRLNELEFINHDDSNDEFDVNDFMDSQKLFQISISDEIDSDIEYIGEIYGNGSFETGYYYAFSKESNDIYNKIGLIVPNDIFRKIKESKIEIVGYEFIGSYSFEKETWDFISKTYKVMSVYKFNLINNLYSRNEGLLESNVMMNKYAIISGCGSVGSFVAMSLVMAGVSKFILIDNDIVKLHNLCRAMYDMKDLGRYKVEALKDLILRKNPNATVITYKSFIEEIGISEFFNLGKNGIMIGLADDRRSDAVTNELSYRLGIPFVSIGCWTRAACGEVFYWKPNSDMKRYKDAFKNLLKHEVKNNGNYIGDEELGKVKFEPGIFTDIANVTIKGIMIILDLLNLDSDGYTKRVLDYLTNYTLICNTNNPEIGGESVSIFPTPLYVSDSIEFK